MCTRAATTNAGQRERWKKKKKNGSKINDNICQSTYCSFCRAAFQIDLVYVPLVPFLIVLSYLCLSARRTWKRICNEDMKRNGDWYNKIAEEKSTPFASYFTIVIGHAASGERGCWTVSESELNKFASFRWRQCLCACSSAPFFLSRKLLVFGDATTKIQREKKKRRRPSMSTKRMKRTTSFCAVRLILFRWTKSFYQIIWLRFPLSRFRSLSFSLYSYQYLLLGCVASRFPLYFSGWILYPWSISQAVWRRCHTSSLSLIFSVFHSMPHFGLCSGMFANVVCVLYV